MRDRAVLFSEGAMSEAPRDLPPLAGYWRRLAAWTVDCIVLGMLGQILVWMQPSYWFEVGPNGRVVGLLVLLAYFGVMGSRLANGQTLGKRLLKIAVRDERGAPIGVGRALLRASILVLPHILNGWAMPGLDIGVLRWLDGVIVFGVGGALLYTMNFNRRAWQGLHDLVCGTRVVHLGGEPIAVFPATARVHWVVVGLIMTLAVVAMTGGGLFASPVTERAGFSSLQQLSRTLQGDDRLLSVGVNDMTMLAGRGKPNRMLQVRAWFKGQPSRAEADELMKDMARVVLADGENAERYDVLRFSVISSFDIGIASGAVTQDDGEPPKVWRERLATRP